MDTPWGQLGSLDPLDRDLALRILSDDKHTLLEGLVVENTFDQILQPLTVGADPVLTPLDVETAVADADGKRLAFVWARSVAKTKGLRRYLQCLEKVAETYLVTYEAGTFVAHNIRQGARSGPRTPLREMLSDMTGRKPRPPSVDASVRDPNRQKAAFWGFLNSTYPGRHLWDRIVLARIFINYGIQPFFRRVWNLDRICLFHDKERNSEALWMLEVKHKYPMKGVPLQFGINNGEIGIMELTAKAGIRTMHGIIVKPVWDKSIGAMYLHSDMAKRERAAVIGAVLDLSDLEKISLRKSHTASSHTSLSGSEGVKFKSLRADEFKLLGTYAEGTEKLSQQLSSLLSGSPIASVTDHALSELRFK